MSEPKSLDDLVPAETLADGMVSIDGRDDGRFVARIVDEEDWVPLEIQDDIQFASDIAADAVGILSRLIERERKAAFEAGRRSVLYKLPQVPGFDWHVAIE